MGGSDGARPASFNNVASVAMTEAARLNLDWVFLNQGFGTGVPTPWRTPERARHGFREHNRAVTMVRS